MYIKHTFHTHSSHSWDIIKINISNICTLLQKYNFSGLHTGSYPVTSHWKHFPYDLYNITDFWTDAVYDESFITFFGLNGLDASYVELQTSLHLTTGMCHTIRPKTEVSAVAKNPGYRIYLLHDLYAYDQLRDKEAGWYIYVHEVKEKFSENINIYSGRQAKVFVPVGEQVEVSLDVYQFRLIQNCSNDPSYNLAECEEKCWVNEDISPKTNCSGPWLPILNKPLCNEPSGMIDLVKATERMCPTNCCPKSCKSLQYKTSVVKRTPNPVQRKLSSEAWIYFGSKAVEYFNYLIN
ncbi:UNVERIFIED_CONTAM: hypothetical protein PYX00_005466 [Menopon gallinae]|uniref:Uncharacterized protein n=1 Tax=Menopon gallinae TaxID=328185 RepID=A0AAW2HST7_9NEOP